MRTIGIRVSGKVQGVFFRQSTRELARSLELKGWVRNEENGDVFITVNGENDSLEKLISWCRSGPPTARVTRVETTELPLQEFSGFMIDR